MDVDEKKRILSQWVSAAWLNPRVLLGLGRRLRSTECHSSCVCVCVATTLQELAPSVHASSKWTPNGLESGWIRTTTNRCPSVSTTENNWALCQIFHWVFCKNAWMCSFGNDRMKVNHREAGPIIQIIQSKARLELKLALKLQKNSLSTSEEYEVPSSQSKRG